MAAAQRAAPTAEAVREHDLVAEEHQARVVQRQRERTEDQRERGAVDHSTVPGCFFWNSFLNAAPAAAKTDQHQLPHLQQEYADDGEQALLRRDRRRAAGDERGQPVLGDLVAIAETRRTSRRH
jgi:hypothetical protein